MNEKKKNIDIRYGELYIRRNTNLNNKLCEAQ